VAVLDKHSEQNGIKQGVLEKGMPVTHGRGDVYIAVLVGGMGHHFVDALSHYADPVSGKYYPRGRFALITPQDPSLILVYVIFAAFIAALFIVNGIRKKSINKTMFARLPSLLRSKQFLLAVVFTGIALVNCGAMYLVMASKNVVVTDTADFNGQEYVRIFFYLGNALFATHIYDSGEFVVYSAICILVFVIVFMFAYVKRVKISIRRIAVRLDVLAIIGFVLSIVIGYLLQPVFGNISGEERDFGAFIFLWSTIGTLLAGAASIKAMPSNVGAIRVDETNK
nr:hypothetical protein [Candidatus Sigynarchaeota archaeon]